MIILESARENVALENARCVAAATFAATALGVSTSQAAEKETAIRYRRLERSRSPIRSAFR